MIARGFKPVAWVAAIGTAALGCYMLSLQVAAERAELAGLERRIVAAQQDIRSLQTELGTRGRLQQLEQWNAEVLALSAPVAGQFLESNLSLARFDVRQRTVADQAEMRMAAAEPAPAQPVQAGQAAIRLAAAPAPAVSPAASPAPAPALVEAPLIRRASLQSAPAQPAALRLPSAPPRRSAGDRPTAVQTRSARLLDAGTLDDLSAAAQTERGGATGD
ncbi:MAG TPA: hypothetical protein VN231_06855 [Allosphingosinicella sp.]|nr:hypothetical protein [Allosphingosinicella sp.]